MMRQAVSKLRLNSLSRGLMSTATRRFADKRSPCGLCPDEAEQKRQNIAAEKTKKQEEPLCKQHGEMVPEFDQLKNLKSFELKSDCNKFHWISEGHDQ